MSEEIRKVLEALQRGEITPEEAEVLIEAIKSREENNQEESVNEEIQWRMIKEEYHGSISGMGENIWITPEGKVLGDVDIVKGKVKLEGHVDGNLDAVASQIEFGGTVSGNVNIVGGTVKWYRGEIKGNLEIVGAKEIGSRPLVGGKVEVLAGPIGSMVGKIIGSTLNTTMDIVGTIPDKISKLGKVITLEDIREGNLTIDKNFKTHSNLYGKNITINGNVMCKDVHAERLIVNGLLTCDDINSSIIEVRGTIKCDDIFGEKMEILGTVSGDDIEVDEVIVNGNLSCDDISTKHMEVSGKAKCDDISTTMLIVNGELRADDVIASKVVLGKDAVMIVDSLTATEGIVKEEGAILKIKEET